MEIMLLPQMVRANIPKRVCREILFAYCWWFAVVDRATSSYRIDIENASNSQTDLSLTDTAIHGDLA